MPYNGLGQEKGPSSLKSIGIEHIEHSKTIENLSWYRSSCLESHVDGTIFGKDKKYYTVIDTECQCTGTIAFKL